MENIFDTLIKGIPKAGDNKKTGVGEAAKKLPNTIPSTKNADLPTLVADWQKTQNKDTEAAILLKLQPTIHSAMTSFARGQDSKLAIAAAKITVDALKTFDPSKASVQTHVFNNLKRLSRINAQRGNIIHMPEDTSRAKRFLADLTNRYQDEHGREPSVGELADLSGFNTKKIQTLLDMNQVTSTTSTLSEDTKRATGGSKDISQDDYYEYVYASCDPINQKIMDWTAGKHGQPPLSNQEIAAKLRMTPAAVSQRRAKIQGLMSDVRGLL